MPSHGGFMVLTPVVSCVPYHEHYSVLRRGGRETSMKQLLGYICMLSCYQCAALWILSVLQPPFSDGRSGTACPAADWGGTGGALEVWHACWLLVGRIQLLAFVLSVHGFWLLSVVCPAAAFQRRPNGDCKPCGRLGVLIWDRDVARFSATCGRVA